MGLHSECGMCRMSPAGVGSDLLMSCVLIPPCLPPFVLWYTFLCRSMWKVDIDTSIHRLMYRLMYRLVHATGFSDEPLRNEDDTPDDWPEIGRASNSQPREENRDPVPANDSMGTEEGGDESPRGGGEEEVDAEEDNDSVGCSQKKKKKKKTIFSFCRSSRLFNCQGVRCSVAA